MIKHCVICGAEFKVSPSYNRSTCLKPDCTKEYRKLAHTGKGGKWNEESRRRRSAKGKTANLMKGTPAAQQSPLAGSFETNKSAKSWVLVSPEGQEYKFRNLRLWCKNNCHLFDRKPDQIAAGIRGIKRYQQGKSKMTVSSYLGWTLKDWGE